MVLQRIATTAAAGALLLAGSTGCSDDPPKPGTVDDPPTAEQEPGNDSEDDDGDTLSDNGGQPEDDPTQYESAEDMPDELLQAEMESFVGEFFRLSDEAMVSGDTSQASELVTEGCEPCWHQLEYTESVHQDGNRIEGGEYADGFSLEIVAVEDNIIETHVEGSYDKIEIFDPEGNVVDSHDAVEFWLYFGIERNDDGTYTITRGRNM